MVDITSPEQPQPTQELSSKERREQAKKLLEDTEGALREIPEYQQTTPREYSDEIVRQVVFGRGAYQYETIIHYPHKRVSLGRNKPNQIRILISGPYDQSTSQTSMQHRTAIVDLRTADPLITFSNSSDRTHERNTPAASRDVRETINALRTAGMTTSQ